MNRFGAMLRWGLPVLLSAAICLSVAADWREQLEADWLQQDEVRGLPAYYGPVTTAEDAAGAVDGVRDGTYGFHTGFDETPWWQVDLGGRRALESVLVYNRCDAGMAARASRLVVSLSDDGKSWKDVYHHDGTEFLGATDNKPLAIALYGQPARYVRIHLPGRQFLHFDEVEVFPKGNPGINIARGRRAGQSSTSQWSTLSLPALRQNPASLNSVIERAEKLADDLAEKGVDIAKTRETLRAIRAELKSKGESVSTDARRDLYLRVRRCTRELALANPLIDFDKVLFVKRQPGSFSHMSDQYYGWWSRPGGGVYLLEGIKSDEPAVRCLTDSMPEGSFLRPDLSHDGTKVLFAYCKYYLEVRELKDKANKQNLPEDAFYHVYEMNIDGTGLRQLTRGRYDDFDARYLPSGEIVFLSTRRGQFIQTGRASAMLTADSVQPDSYVRCGGDAWRPVAVYTLHVMDRDGGEIRCISPFENFEWTPSVTNDGRVVYARWDYVDRDNMPYMSLWSTNPDGTNPQIVYGNFTHRPHCVFEARSIPGSRKMIFTGSGHHSITAGSLVLLDPGRGVDGTEPLDRITPEVCFPEIEGWPSTYYVNPWPLSERYFLTAWSNIPLARQGALNPPNALGIYIYDVFGNLELLHRDPEISSMYPIPVRPRSKPPVISSSVAWDGPQEGRMALLDVYDRLPGITRGAVKSLRVVGVPAKTQPNMNQPVLGITHDDPGKFVLGTVPVEEDGSAYFRVPSGVGVFFQALDDEGRAIQTMRSLTYVQPNQTVTCIGCHEHRTASPRNARPVALRREASKLRRGPDGSWPMRYDRLVQPVLDRQCVSCHRPDSENEGAKPFDLTAGKSYENLISYGKPSLRDHVMSRYRSGRSVAGACVSRQSVLLAKLREDGGHEGVELSAEDMERLITWMDTYSQVRGSFSDDQEQRLLRKREEWQNLLLSDAGR